MSFDDNEDLATMFSLLRTASGMTAPNEQNNTISSRQERKRRSEKTTHKQWKNFSLRFESFYLFVDHYLTSTLIYTQFITEKFFFTKLKKKFHV